MKPYVIRVIKNDGVLEDSIEHLVGEHFRVSDTYQYEDQGSLSIEVNDTIVPLFAEEYEVVEWV
jgi:hypothetical protein